MVEQHATSASALGLAKVARRRAVPLILCAVLTPVAAYAFSASQEKQYTASASLLFRDPQLDQTVFGSSGFESSQDPDREAATNVRLVSLRAVADRAERRLPGIDSVSSKVRVSAEGQSNVVTVAATDSNRSTAARIANTFAEEYIRFRRQADQSKVRGARELVSRQLRRLSPAEREGPRGRSLRQRGEELQILASLQTGNAELVQRAKPPTSASAPKPVRSAVIGAFLGLLIGVGLALLLERLDRRIRDPKEMERIFNRPVLSAIPESRALAKSGPVGKGSRDELEAFQMLRANLRYFNVDRDIKSVLITSAAPGDGKTTVAWNLASAASSSGTNALVIEADLRHPRLSASLGSQSTQGLSTVLSGEIELEEAVQQVPVAEGRNGRVPRTVDVLLAGPIPPNPADLLESDRMRELIKEAEGGYDLVVIDTPPTSVVSDAIPLLSEVGGVVVVGRLGKSTREAVGHLKNQLENLDAPTLGVVVNAMRAGRDPYGYGYAYGYAYEPNAS